MTTSVRDELTQAIREIDAVLAEVQAVCRRAADVTVKPGEPWGLKETVCHFIWWHQFTSASVERVLAGGQAEPPTQPVDDLNASAVAALSGKSLAALADQLDAEQRRLVVAMKKLPDPSVIVMRRPNGQAFNAPDRLRAMAKHMAGHLAELR